MYAMCINPYSEGGVVTVVLSALHLWISLNAPTFDDDNCKILIKTVECTLYRFSIFYSVPVSPAPLFC